MTPATTITNTCTDARCAAHHHLSIRGRRFTGVVLAAKAQKTATIEWTRRRYIPKFERYEVAQTRVHAHNPACIGAKPGDLVEIAESRRLSKTKSFVITKKLGVEREALERAEHKYDVINRPHTPTASSFGAAHAGTSNEDAP